jgi:serine/threonine protein kinase
MSNRTCEACGFENAELEKPCPLCGVRETQKISHVDALITRDMRPDQTPTRDLARTAPVDATERLGQVFADRYRVDALIGAGGMGQVFRARDTREHRDLALKVLHSSREDDADRTERFKREIGILSRIKHPAVPAIMDFGLHESELFFVSELVDGTDLKTEIKRRGPWNPVDAAALAAGVAEALAVAHSLGVVHRDVKPSNIMVARDGAVKLLDFGLARGVGIDVTTLTRTGTIVGTPSYMSPEQFDTHGVDERSDIYSLGVVLFEMLTGKLPFTGQTPVAIAIKHKIEPARPPRALRSELPAWIDRVVVRCLEKDPAHRFATAADLCAELRRSRGAGPHTRRLPSGDAVIEDDSGSTSFALVLSSASEKTGWALGMGFRMEERYYRLDAVKAPSAESRRWTYRFAAWPEGLVFRRLVDYEQDCAERSSPSVRGLGSKLTRWMKRS